MSFQFFVHCIALAALGASGALACGSKTVIDSPDGDGAKTPCETLDEAYRVALTASRTCNPESDSDQCRQAVNDALLCPCRTNFVNPDHEAFAELAALTAELDALECKPDELLCPSIGCVQPTGANCVPQAGRAATVGRCQDF